MNLVQYETLKKFTAEVLEKIGLDAFSVESVTTGLCETSLRGVDSHGIRLFPHYVESALTGRKNPIPEFKFTHKYPTVALLDADDAFGHAAGMRAIEKCMEIADEYGVGIVGVSNSSHPGAMGSFALRAARKGYIAMALTHADSLMLSHGGKRPFFGTNPVCVAVPRQGEAYCLDMATTMIPWNKVLLYKAKNMDLDPDLVADENGKMTTNISDASCLMPIGSYKGYGLASMVEIFCSVFTGMKFGRSIPSMYGTPMKEQRKLGQFYMAFKADACVEYEDFIESMTQLTMEIHSEPAISQEKVILPGDREIMVAEDRMKNGIPIDDVTYEALTKISSEYNVPL